MHAYLNADSEGKLLHVLEAELLAKRETELLEKENSGWNVLLPLVVALTL